MKIKNIIAILTLSLFSSVVFAANFNLYSEASTDSKVIAKIDSKNEDQFIKFYTDKDGKWAKYANSKTGQVGWLDLGSLNKDKANNLRQELIKNVDKKINYYNQQIAHLNKDKVMLSKASYKDLQHYHQHTYYNFQNNWDNFHKKFQNELIKFQNQWNNF